MKTIHESSIIIISCPFQILFIWNNKHLIWLYSISNVTKSKYSNKDWNSSNTEKAHRSFFPKFNTKFNGLDLDTWVRSKQHLSLWKISLNTKPINIVEQYRMKAFFHNLIPPNGCFLKKNIYGLSHEIVE